jgi:diguanylate cyclase (GGDEF)-like protein
VGDQHFDWHAAPLKSLLKGWVCVLHNITVRTLTQEMLQHHAFHDALTQVPNRSYFVDHLQRANLLTRNEPGYQYAVLFVDLDDLKSFNDNFGHHVGDELLYSFARRIEDSIRPGDVVARLGGDEFAVFLDHIGQAADAIQVATRVREAVSKPYHLSSHAGDVHTTASIGIALSDPRADAETLLRNADKAMYDVKQSGGDNFGLFEPEPASPLS